MKIYVNGIEKGSVAQTGAIDAVTDPVIIGRNVVNPAFVWQGGLDEIDLFNRALSQSEIAAIVTADSAGKCVPTPTVATVDGKVLTSDGRGLRNATVLITDSQGVARISTTSSFGFYSFADIPIGAQYRVTVRSRLFRYQPQIVMVNGNVTLPDFVGLE